MCLEENESKVPTIVMHHHEWATRRVPHSKAESKVTRSHSEALSQPQSPLFSRPFAPNRPIPFPSRLLISISSLCYIHINHSSHHRHHRALVHIAHPHSRRTVRIIFFCHYNRPRQEKKKKRLPILPPFTCPISLYLPPPHTTYGLDHSLYLDISNDPLSLSTPLSVSPFGLHSSLVVI